MDVVSNAALPVQIFPWQSHAGGWTITIVARATLELTPLACVLADTQDPVQDGDAHLDDDPARSLMIADDLVPLKPRADVTLVGSAFAPRGGPARSLIARLSIGEIDKSIEVHADRFAAPDGSITEGQPFARMPLIYERAAGGPGTWNPVGVKPGARDGYGRAALPNLHMPQTPGGAAGQVTACFGPVAAGWPLRRQKVGRHAASSMVGGRWRALPLDVDPGYFNAAPPDQQLAVIRGDEGLVLENLHPSVRRLTTRLPGLAPYAIVDLARGSQRLDLRCDTVAIDTDRGLCALTFRAQLQVDEPDPAGRILLALDEPSAPSRGQDHTLAANPEAQAARVLPFVGRPDPSPPAFVAPPPIAPIAPPPITPIAPIAPAPLPVEPPPAIVEATPADVRPPSALAAGEALELLWLASENMPRVRRRKVFRAILDAQEETPIDEELDDPSLSATPAAIEDRRDAAAILTRGDPISPERLADVLEEGLAGGAFTAKIALVAGDLSFSFDEVKLLEAWAATLTPLATEDDRLRRALESARDFLGSRGAATLPVVAEGLSAQLREVLRQGRRPAAEGAGVHVERSALEQRAYARRNVLGGPHLRAELSMGSAPGVPVYVPEAIAAALPLMSRFRARLLAEVYPRVDQGEAHATALRAVAVGRVIVLGKRGR